MPLLTGGDVMLLSSSLSDQLATVALVKRRLLFATVAALLIAVVLGFAVAALHARRLGRLQRAADRIAEGAFDEPVVDDDHDEVGQLAASFDRMRLQLAQLDSARKEFVANASHELRTPLFSLAGFLELLADEDLDESTRARVPRDDAKPGRPADEARDRPARPLADGRGPDPDRARGGRPGRGRAPGRRGLLRPRGCVGPQAPDRRRRGRVGARRRGAGAADRRAPSTGNALVHTPAGTTVRLRVERRGTRVALVVEDDGPGIPPEHLDRIFQRFYRVEGGQASGSGLGLAIARELAGRMGGTVSVASRPGATAFTLELPAEPAEPREPAPPARLSCRCVSTWKRTAVAVTRRARATVARAPRSSPSPSSPRFSARPCALALGSADGPDRRRHDDRRRRAHGRRGPTRRRLRCPRSATASTRPRSTPGARPASSRSTPTSAPTGSRRAPASSSTAGARSSRTPTSSRTSPPSAAAASTAPRRSTSSSRTATACPPRSSAGTCSATSPSCGSTPPTTHSRRCRSARPPRSSSGRRWRRSAAPSASRARSRSASSRRPTARSTR